MKPPTPHDELLSRSLQSLERSIAAETQPPLSNPIWLRAQRERRRLAIARATRPLRIIEGLAFLCSLLLIAFVLHQSASTRLTPTALELGGLGLATILAGGFVLLHLARKSPTRV